MSTPDVLSSAEAVILSIESYERMLSLLEDAEIAQIVRERRGEPTGEPVDLTDYAESIGVGHERA